MATAAFCFGRRNVLRNAFQLRCKRPRALNAAAMYFRNKVSTPKIGRRVPKINASSLISKLYPLPLIDHDKKVELSGQLPIPKKKHGRFISPWPKTYKKLTDILQLAISNYNAKWNELPQEMNTLPAVAVNKELLKSTDHPHVTWIGHSTCYVQLNGKFFLTDPIWSARASMFQWIGPKRFRPPPIKLDDLHIDYVLVSHDHYDHFDADTAKRIGDRAKWLVPKGLKKTLGALGVTNVVELSWWETYKISRNNSSKSPTTGTKSKENVEVSLEKHEDCAPGDIEIVFTPTQHWCCRSIFDRCRVLWGSFCVLSREHKFFFAGDTAYNPIFKSIGKIYGPFDLSMLPIGAYKPRWFLRDHHVDPSEALQLHQDLDSKQSVAIHWGTFKLSEERCVEPALELGRVREYAGFTASSFTTMAHGETLKFGDNPQFDYTTLYPQFLTEHIEKNDY